MNGVSKDDDSASKSELSSIENLFKLDRYLLILEIFNEFAIFCVVSNMVFMIFGGAQPHVDCTKVPVSVDLNYSDDGNTGVNSSKSAHSVTKSSYEFKSAAIEFDLLCDQKWWSAYATSIQMTGLIVGAFINGLLSDRLGRRKVLLVNLYALNAFCALSALSPNFIVFLIFRFIIGCFVGGVNTVLTVFVIENLPTSHRFWLCNVVTLSPNYALFASVAYLAGEWRKLAYFSSIVSLPSIVLLTYFIQESPHYLVQKGRTREAIQALVAINSWRTNKHRISKEQIARLVAVEMSKRNEQHNAKGEKRFSYIDLYSSRKLLTYTIVTSFSLFVINCVTYSLVFNMSQVQGSIYVNTAISGILRYCIGIAIAVVDYIYVNAGRKLVHIVSMAVIDMCLGGVLVLLHFAQFDPSNQTANNILGLAERFNYLIRIFTLTTFGITGSIFAQVLLISAELFPTVVRNLANAHSNVVARVGTTLAPLIFQLSILSQSAPYLLLITLSTIDIFAILFAIPETKNTHLAHFISDELNGESTTTTTKKRSGSSGQSDEN